MRLALPLVIVASLSLAACGNKGSPDAQKDAPAASGAASAAASAKAKAEAPADELTITAKAPTVGMKVEEKETNDMRVELELQLGGKPKTFDVRENESMVKRIEVLAVDGKAITKEKITYVEKKKATFEDGKEKKTPKSPIEGKTYIVEWKDKTLFVTDEKGKKVSRAEEDAVKKNNNSLGKVDPVLAGLPDKPVKIGESVPALGKAFEAYFKDRDEKGDAPTVGGVDVKLQSIEKQGAETVGVFAIKLTMSSEPSKKQPFSMKAPLEGDFRVRAKDGLTTAVVLRGSLTMNSDDPKLKMTGKGGMKMSVELSY